MLESPAAELFFLSDGASAALEEWGPLEEATGPAMATAGLTLWKDDAGNEVGIWECGPGPSHWELQTHEFVHILSGSMTVTPTGGESYEIGPGATVLFPKGWSGEWELHEKLRKAYAIFG